MGSPPRIDNLRSCAGLEIMRMTDQQNDPLAQFGLDVIDLRWTLKDIDSKRTWLINKDHLPKLIELGLVEMREGTPYLSALLEIRKSRSLSLSRHMPREQLSSRAPDPRAQGPIGLIVEYEAYEQHSTTHWPKARLLICVIAAIQTCCQANQLDVRR